MLIGYAKIGRAMPLVADRFGVVGGDPEPPRLLYDLATRHPQHKFVILSKTSDDPQEAGLPSNVISAWTPERREWLRTTLKPLRGNADAVSAVYDQMLFPVFDKLDALVIWLGQHGTSNSRIPTILGSSEGTTKTNPQESFINYAGPIIRGVNRWRDVDPFKRQEVWLIADARNYLKGRDLKWPPGEILGQYEMTRADKHYRWGDTMDPMEWSSEVAWSDTGVWKAIHHYAYSGLELTAVSDQVQCNYQWEGRYHFGIVINEARGYVSLNRLDAMRDWVMPLNPVWIRGKWSDESQRKLGVKIEPVEWKDMWSLLPTVRCTFTTPSSGSGWATTKPWEAFSVGVVCFFHPKYDDQGWIIPTKADAEKMPDSELKHLALWLRVSTPEQLEQRVRQLSHDPDAWLWLVQAQRRHFEQRYQQRQHIKMIEERCGL